MEPATEPAVIRTVVRALATLAVIGLLGVILLAAVHTPGDILAAVVGLATGPSSALAAILVSTRSGPQAATSDPPPSG